MKTVYKGFTEKALRKAFNKVKDMADWRNPIFKRVLAPHVAVTVAAIEFYTGTNVKVRKHPSGIFDYSVESVGYRNGPCGT